MIINCKEKECAKRNSKAYGHVSLLIISILSGLSAELCNLNGFLRKKKKRSSVRQMRVCDFTAPNIKRQNETKTTSIDLFLSCSLHVLYMFSTCSLHVLYMFSSTSIKLTGEFVKVCKAQSFVTGY